MSLFSKIFEKRDKNRKNQIEERGVFFDSLMYNQAINYSTSKALLISSVYRCTEVISDSVAQLPLEPYIIDSNGYKNKFRNHPSYYLLNKEPNSKMSRFIFMKTMVVSMLLKGNAYALIKRDSKGDVTELQYIPADLVTIINDKDGIYYSVVGMKNRIEDCNMIHLLNFTYDGITGVSTLQHAKNTLSLSMDSENHASGFFKGGANVAGILKVHSVLNSKQKQDLKNSWQTAFSPTTGTPNGVAVLEGNMDFQPITVNPSDAQLLETRQFNVIDVCRFFGVSPVKAFDLSKSSYSTVEATQLAFLTDTLAPLLEKIELEFERKLYKPSERKNIEVRFDTSSLLRADKSSQATYLKTLFDMGALSINEIRKNLDLEPIEGGDNNFVQVNTISLEDVLKKYKAEYNNNNI